MNEPITEQDVDEAARWLRAHRVAIALGDDPEAERIMTSEAYPA